MSSSPAVLDPPRSSPAAADRSESGTPLETPSFVEPILNAIPDPATVLDEERRIVIANASFLDLLPEPTRGIPPGARFGDALACVHATESRLGCGSTPFCRHCGAMNAIVRSRARERPEDGIASIFARRGGRLTAHELGIHVAPIMLQGRVLTLFTVRDLADASWRRALEGLFYHDVLDGMGALRGLLGILRETGGEEARSLNHEATAMLDDLIESILTQRDLAAAEAGELSVTPRTILVPQFLERIVARHARLAIARGRIILPPSVIGGTLLRTDESLLAKVLSALLRNALEASSPGQAVAIRCRNDGVARFRVASDPVMAPDVKARVFQRSFTTKPPDSPRGLGTFGARLLAENYLGGTLTFISTPGAGTIFSLTVPDLGT